MHDLENEINYEEDMLIGSGSYGTVTRGFCKTNQIFIAIKGIFVGNCDAVEIINISKEVIIQKGLFHENLINCYGSKHQKNYLEIYFEYMAKGTLAEKLKKSKRLPEKKA